MIPLFYVHMPTTVDHELLDVIHSGYITEGPKVRRFEELIAEFLGNPYVLAVNSGTSALALAYRMAGLGPGTEVIVTAMTCTATIVPICATGARIVWADIDPYTGLIDPEDVRRKMTRSVRAVVGVDWGGKRIDVKALRAAVGGVGVPIIEDAAHAFGATRAGSEADFTAFSFQAIKHITTGDGGALAVLNPEHFARGKKLRWFGLDREYKAGLDNRVGQPLDEWGYKFHMNDIAATIGIAQMDHIERIVREHKRHASRYCIELDPAYVRPPFDPFSAYWLFTLLLPDAASRLNFQEQAKSVWGIGASQVHGRCDTLTAFRRYAGGGGLPGVTEFSRRQVSIPVHWALTDQEQSFIIEYLNRFAKEEL